MLNVEQLIDRPFSYIGKWFRLGRNPSRYIIWASHKNEYRYITESFAIGNISTFTLAERQIEWGKIAEFDGYEFLRDNLVIDTTVQIGDTYRHTLDANKIIKCVSIEEDGTAYFRVNINTISPVYLRYYRKC